MTTDVTYPLGALSAEQEEAADFGRQLFERLAAANRAADGGRFAATAGPAGAVVVARRVKGGGRIYVAADRSVLYVASHLSTVEADAAFVAGERTPVEKFGPPLTS